MAAVSNRRICVGPASGSAPPGRWRLIAPGEEAFGRSAKPAQGLKHDGAGHRSFHRHAPQRADADGYGRGVLERRVDLGGELIPCQLARAPLVVERGVQRAHVELEQAAHFNGSQNLTPRAEPAAS